MLLVCRLRLCCYVR